MTTNEEIENLLPHLSSALKREIISHSFNAEELLVPVFADFINFLEIARKEFSECELAKFIDLPDISTELEALDKDLNPEYNPMEPLDFHKKDAAYRMVYHSVKGFLFQPKPAVD